MILGQNECSAVEQIAQEAGINGNPEELVSNALNAIINGYESDVAYAVTEAAGVVWIVPFVWYRKGKKLTAELARRIIKQAKSDKTYEGPLPDDDEKAIEEAGKLVDMAQEAWDNSVHGAEVEAILRIAAQGENGDSADSQEKKDNSPPPTGEVSDPEPGSDDPEQLANEEPWEGYAGEKVAEIIEAVGIAIEDDTEPEQEKDNLLAHIWAYESAHKKRTRILTHLTKIGEARGPAEEEPQAAEAGEGEAPDASAPEADAGDAEGAQGSEEDGKEAGDADDGESEPVAGDEPERPADETSPEDRPGEDASEEATEDTDSYRGLIADAKADVDQQRLHTPSMWEGEIEELPADLSTVNDKMLQRLYSQFASLAYHAGYLLMVEEASERRCRQALTEMSNGLLVAAAKYDDHDKAKTITILEAEIGQDPAIKKWKRRVGKHAAFAGVHRQERDSYNKLVESLSRLASMRQDEFERAGGKKR